MPSKLTLKRKDPLNYYYNFWIVFIIVLTFPLSRTPTMRNKFIGSFKCITSCLFLPTDYRECGWGWLPFTNTITIDWPAVGHPSTSTNTVQKHISIAIAWQSLSFGLKIPLRRNSTTYRWNTTLQGILSQTCRQYCYVFLYFMCNNYNLSFSVCLSLIVNAM